MKLNLFFSILLFVIEFNVGSNSENNEVNTIENNAVNETKSSLSSEGLQFVKEESIHGPIINYDCSVGLVKEGYIDFTDIRHPSDMSSLIVQNCKNVTLRLSCCLKTESGVFHYLIIKNVSALTITECKTTDFLLKNTNFTSIYVSDVQHMEIQKNFLKDPKSVCNRLQSFRFKNVKIDSIRESALDNLFLSEFFLNEVIVKNIEEKAISFKGNSTSILSFTDSHFENVQRKAFQCDVSQVEIYNNSFQNLAPEAFKFTANESFDFTGNYVKKISDSFVLFSPKVTITWNTFVTTLQSWVSRIVITGKSDFRFINVSNNTLSLLPDKFLVLNSTSRPDTIIFSNNYLNCTCRNHNFFRENVDDTNLVRQIFFDKDSNNVCLNFNNCTVNELIGKMSAVCTNKFVLVGNEETVDQKVQNENRFDELLTYLKNMSETLTQFIQTHQDSREIKKTEPMILQSVEPAI